MNKLILGFFILPSLFFIIFTPTFAVTNISINASVVKNNDFAQILGGYLAQDCSIDVNNSAYTDPGLIAAAKETLPQDPAHPVLMRVQNGRIGWDQTLNQVRLITRFCKNVNCDPMFDSYFSGADYCNGVPGFRANNDQLRTYLNYVKNECKSVFGDDKHCLHWNFGNEPTSQPSSCVEFANNYYEKVQIVKEVFPNSEIHSLELYSPYNVRIQGTSETIGECIVRELNNKTPKVKMDVLQAHWYLYHGELDILKRTYTDGLKLISNYNGVYDRFQGMEIPHEMVDFMTNYANKYEVSRGADIGIGEFNVSDMYDGYGNVAPQSDITAGCAWLSNRYGESKVTCSGSPARCKCKPPASFETKRLNLSWGAAFWHLDELPIMAEAGVKYVQRHVFNGTGAFPIMGNNGGRVPSAYAYGFLAKNFGNTVLDGSSSDPAVLAGHASLDKDRNLRVLLVNKTGNQQTSKINLAGFTASGKATAYFFQVPSNGGLYFNGGTNSGEQVTPVPVANQEGITVSSSFDYSVPGYTAVILKIPGQSSGFTPVPTQQPLSLKLSSGWNYLTWKSEWGTRTESDLPEKCQLISYYADNQFKTSTNKTLIPGQNYFIFCQ